MRVLCDPISESLDEYYIVHLHRQNMAISLYYMIKSLGTRSYIWSIID